MTRIVPTIDQEGMHGAVTVSPKRQVTIPSFARRDLGLVPGSRVTIEGHLAVRPGDRLLLTVRNKTIILQPVEPSPHAEPQPEKSAATEQL